MKTCILIMLMALMACKNDKFVESGDGFNVDLQQARQQEEQRQAAEAPEHAPRQETVTPPTQPGGMTGGSVSSTGQRPEEPTRKQEIAKKIIKTGQLSIRVDEYKETAARVEAIVKKYEGYTSAFNEVNTEHGLQTETTIRVPGNNFDACMNELVALASFVENRTVSTEDVTAEFVDLQARLKTKREVEARYVEILKSAKTIEDVLRVENELRVIREEIEAKQGRLHYLSNQVSYSTITLRYTRTNQEYVKPPEETFVGRFFSGFSNGWQGLLGFFVVLANLWPVLIVGGAAAWWAKRRWWKRQ